MTTTFSGEAFPGDEAYASPFAGMPDAATEQQAQYSAADEPCRCRPETTAHQPPAESMWFPLAHESPEQAKPDAGELWVPGAERVPNQRSHGGAYLPAPWRFVFHTIEGEPGPEGFRRLAGRHVNPPHLWAMPSENLLLQTVPLNRSAYALARPGAVQTNRLHAVQVEVWGFAAKMGGLDRQAVDWLAERVLAPVARLVPVNLDRVHPTGGRSCYGTGSRCRISAGHWQSFDGVCGHQHVPDNKHWDPGEMPLDAIAARARVLVAGGGPHEQLSDHDGPAFAAEADDEFSADPVEHEHPGYPAQPPASVPVPPPPPAPPLTGPVPVTRNCCLLDPKSLKDLNTMGRYSDYGGVNSGVPGTVYTTKAGFVDLGHLFAVADVTAYVYQEIHKVKGIVGTTIRTAHGTVTLNNSVPASVWLEHARKIAYADSVAYEIETAKGASSFLPGHLNSAFSPEDLCSNYLGTVVAAHALMATGPAFPARMDNEVRTLLSFLGPLSNVEAAKAFALKNNIWVAWNTDASGLNPYYLKRRNFTNDPWLAGHPKDQPGTWKPTKFGPTAPFTYKHGSGFTDADFDREIGIFRTWAQATFGVDYDKP